MTYKMINISLLNKFINLDFPVVSVGPENPYKVELEHTAEMKCEGK